MTIPESNPLFLLIPHLLSTDKKQLFKDNKEINFWYILSFWVIKIFYQAQLEFIKGAGLTSFFVLLY